MSRLKHLLRLNYGDALAADKREEGEIPVFGSNGPVGTHSVANTSAPTILVGRKGSFGKVVWSDLPGFCIDTAYYVDERSCAGDLRFSFYALQSLGLDTTSRDTGVPGLSREDAHDRRLAIPSREEQTAIARFLDRETARIDGLIEKKGRFIELLKEKRAALITHAVTKGIDAGVPMKDGGFKALGSIPEHWNLHPLGRALRLNKRTVGKRHADFTLLSLTTRGIIVRDISENAGKFPESFETYQEVCPGNFVFCLFDMDETPRTVGRSEVAGMITGAYSVFECIDPVYSSFLLYLFLHLDTCKGLKPFYTGLRKTIRPPRFASIRVPFPPVEEAARIVSYIEDQTARIDGLISKTDRSIELLKEKRSALITAAVTGKIDVRNAA
ncbi:restriction endonuclease subunit S [Paracoccus pantotrophus]|uniref:restriction endonuclease subunit S n=1 Tax=Paracoccus pantotrophus TaxID=82367 RepID=UPI000E099DAE|nr:restriction endonuclease subunit S [Paracoccus pantotrophus]RDD99819.1 restriction endonuclease subunit S [Paracoccus pantotrophus]WGR65424.1 restriction endonuclease subunit S [Paracoccus pantotrophus]